MIKIALSSLPILVILIMIFFLKKSSIITGITACILTIFISIIPIFNVRFTQLLHPIFKSILTTSTIIYILFFGILLFHLMDKSGAIGGIASTIKSSTEDKIYQVLLLALGLSPLIEAVSGFGLAVIVIAPILMALGFNGIKSTLISLISLCIIPWGTLAMGTIIGANLGNVPLEEMGLVSSLMCIPLFIYFATLVSYIAVGRKEMVKRLPEIIFISGTLGGAVWLCNKYFSVELAGLFGALSVILVTFILIQFRKITCKNGNGGFDSKIRKGKYDFLLYIAPYLFLIVTLFASRVFYPLQEFLKSVWNIDLPQYNFQLFILYSPGFFLILSCIFTILIFKLKKSDAVESIKLTVKKCNPVILTTFLFITVSELMAEANMIQVLSSFAANSFGEFFVYITPLIGAMGGFLTGSNTASNTMFIRLQTHTAVQIGLPPLLLASAQNVSSSLMTMVNPSRVTLGASICKISNRENEIQKKMALVGAGTLIIILIELAIYLIF